MNLNKIAEMLKHKKLTNEDTFIKLFDFSFKKLVKTNEDKYFDFIIQLINYTDNQIVNNYFSKKTYDTDSIVVKKKYEYFKEILNENIYLELQEENYKNSEF